jgi:hypothetical protein
MARAQAGELDETAPESGARFVAAISRVQGLVSGRAAPAGRSAGRQEPPRVLDHQLIDLRWRHAGALELRQDLV